MKKFLKSLLLVILIAAVLGFAWLFFISPEERFQSVYLVPENAAYIVETENPFEAWEKIIHSEAWDFLKSNELLAEINQKIENLDSVISSKRILLRLFGSRKILLSAHQYRPGSYQFLFVVDLKKTSRLKSLQNQIIKLSGDEISFTQRTYKEQEIFELFHRKSGNIYYFSLIKNQLIFSKVHTLIEASIDQLDKLTLGRDLNYIEVSRRTSGKGLFSVCINHTCFRDYITSLLGKSNDFIDQLAINLYYTAASFYIDESGNMQLSGYSSVRDTTGSYISSMIKSGQGPHDIFKLAPARTASLVDIGFNNITRLYQNINVSLGEQSRQNLESTIQNTEKKLKIDIVENLLSWIDDEIVLLQTQPSNLGRKNEFALVFKAKSVGTARENLDFLADQVRKNSPVRFKKIEYKGYVINYLHIPGIFRFLFGKLLARIEKPYYALVDRFVIFSNHPQTIKSIIDDYEKENTLAGSGYYDPFISRFQTESIILIYLQTPVLFNNLREFVSTKTWTDLKNNQKYFECFPHIGLQIEKDRSLLKFELQAEFDPVYEEFVPVKYLFDPVSFYFEDTMVQFPLVREETNDIEPEIVIDDLDVPKHEVFFDDGNIRLSVELKNGQKHGTYREYYKNGELKIRGRYRNDLMDGTWKFYDETGKLTETREYEDGKIKR